LKLSTDNWIAIYAATLSTVIALVAAVRQVTRWLSAHRERGKFQTDLYFLTKIDRRTQEEHPIVVVLAANLGNERIALKSLEYQGISKVDGLKTTGNCGWYEQPDELFGIRNRLLPRVLASGETADFPMLEIGVLINVQQLKVWLTDFKDRRYYLADRDIEKIRRAAQNYMEKNPTSG
jgi:hypothetical protein